MAALLDAIEWASSTTGSAKYQAQPDARQRRRSSGRRANRGGHRRHCGKQDLEHRPEYRRIMRKPSKREKRIPGCRTHETGDAQAPSCLRRRLNAVCLYTDLYNNNEPGRRQFEEQRRAEEKKREGEAIACVSSPPPYHLPPLLPRTDSVEETRTGAGPVAQPLSPPHKKRTTRERMETLLTEARLPLALSDSRRTRRDTAHTNTRQISF